ncbi:MAG: S8 family serine peptidase, partial [bacterium]
MNRKDRGNQHIIKAFLIVALGVAVFVCTATDFVSGQYYGGWPGTFSGLYMGGPFFGSYGSSAPPFSTLSSYASSGASIGFTPLWGGNSAGLFGIQAGSGYSQGLFGGFTQPSVASGAPAWGGSLFGGPWQPVSSFGFSGGYTGGLQSGSTWRTSLGGQNSVMSFSPSWPGSSYNTTGIYQNPLSWTQPVSGYTTPVSSGSTSSSEIAEMPPVSEFQSDAEYVPDQILVKFKDGTTSDKKKDIHDRHGCKEISTSEYSGCTVVEIPADATVEEMVNQYLQEEEVEFAEPNYIRHRHLTPNDPYFSYQWHHSMMNSTSAWNLGRGAGVIVAVLDSGVAYRTGGGYVQASDLAGTTFKAGWDFVNSDPYPDDDNGHGTHMAGCIAQTTNNYRGVAGVAYGATIFPVKIMDESGDVTITNEVDGIYYAVNNGAHIINLSLGG